MSTLKMKRGRHNAIPWVVITYLLELKKFYRLCYLIFDKENRVRVYTVAFWRDSLNKNVNKIKYQRSLHFYVKKNSPQNVNICTYWILFRTRIRCSLSSENRFWNVLTQILDFERPLCAQTQYLQIF